MPRNQTKLNIVLSISQFIPLNLWDIGHTHAHTHTHIYIYIYIYIFFNGSTGSKESRLTFVVLCYAIDSEVSAYPPTMCFYSLNFWSEYENASLGQRMFIINFYLTLIPLLCKKV